MTSILAASGVLAMVVGLAVKANIANIFSGIVLNLERPFRVGDFVKIGSTVGQVKDITWRTIRLESDDGTAIIMPNSKVSEGNMENLSAAPSGISASTSFSLPPDVDPARMKELITEGAMTCKAIVYKDDPDLAPSTRFKGLGKEDGKLVAQFSVGYRVKFGSKKSAAREELWLVMREKFMKEGVNLIDETASKDAKIS
jgi:small-conductance mechanosensitive channel